jgi:hypothetical protein
MEVDRQRERISLSIKQLLAPENTGRPATGTLSRGGGGGRPGSQKPAPQKPQPPQKGATLDDLMRKFNRK